MTTLYTDVADALDRLARALRELPEAPAAATVDQPSPDSQKPEAQTTITLEEVRGKLADISRQGHTEEIRGLFSKLGVSKLSEVDAADYEQLLAAAEELAS